MRNFLYLIVFLIISASAAENQVKFFLPLENKAFDGRPTEVNEIYRHGELDLLRDKLAAYPNATNILFIGQFDTTDLKSSDQKFWDLSWNDKVMPSYLAYYIANRRGAIARDSLGGRAEYGFGPDGVVMVLTLPDQPEQGKIYASVNSYFELAVDTLVAPGMQVRKSDTLDIFIIDGAELGWSNGPTVDRQLELKLSAFDPDSVEFEVYGLTNTVRWLNGEPAGGPQDVALAKRRAPYYAAKTSAFGFNTKVAGIELLTPYTGAKFIVKRRHYPHPPVIIEPAVSSISVVDYLATSAGLTNSDITTSKQVNWSDGSVTTNDIYHYNLNQGVLKVDSLSGRFVALSSGVDTVVSYYKHPYVESTETVFVGRDSGQAPIQPLKYHTDTTFVRVAERYEPPKPDRWFIGGFTASKSYTGAAIKVILDDNKVVQASYGHVNRELVRYQEYFDFSVGRLVTDNLAIKLGFLRESQLDDHWLSHGGYLAADYQYPIASNLFANFEVRGNWSYVHQKLIKDPLEFESDPGGYNYREPIAQPEKWFSRLDGAVIFSIFYEL